MLEYIKEYLKANDVEYKENFKLSKISRIKTGGDSKVLVLPENKLRFLRMLSFFKECKQRYTIVGGASNILFSDKGYDGLVIKTDKLRDFTFTGKSVRAECGTPISALSSILTSRGFSGFERLCGIPGSVGGAVFGNAGAFGSDISQFVKSIEAYDLESGEVVNISCTDADFSYRHSIFSGGRLIILSALMEFKESTPRAVQEESMRWRTRRMETQPYNYPSLGSVFKKPSSDVFVGQLVESCGLKGTVVGGASVSEKHAGFFVNTGDALSSDVVSLINIVSAVVYEKYGIVLEPEIIPVGF